MTFEVGAVLEDPKWQAPVYCFKEGAVEEEEEMPVLESVVTVSSLALGKLIRRVFNTPTKL